MFEENLIACWLELVKITISKISTFDGKSNITISGHLQKLKHRLRKKNDQNLKLYFYINWG